MLATPTERSVDGSCASVETPTRPAPVEDAPAADATEVHRLDSSAIPTAYELFFDLEPHMAAVASGMPLRALKALPGFRGMAKIHLTARTNLRQVTMHALRLSVKAIHWAIRSEADELPDDDETNPRSTSADDGSPGAATTGNSPATLDYGEPPAELSGGPSSSGPVPYFPIPESAREVESWKMDPIAETLRFELGETLAENRQIVLFIQYTGTVHHTSEGLFMASPSDDPFEVATHLEPTNARVLYPCFDEPCFQARCRVSVRAPNLPGYVLLGNTRESTTGNGSARNALDGVTGSGTQLPRAASSMRSGGSMLSVDDAHREEEASKAQEGTRDSSNSTSPATAGTGAKPADESRDLTFTTTTFRTMPSLSSYLVAFVFAKLHWIEAETTRGVITRVFLPSNEPLENAWFTLDLLKKAVEFFETFFDYPLPARKLDIVSVDNLNFLGMENWGLLLFHKEYVPVSETTPLERQQRITRLVGHEVAHQWFGNLVSLRWWRYIWLKEGLARFLEYVFVNAYFPKWDVWQNFIVDILNRALIADSRAVGRHPVEQASGLHPREICELFDVISYGKAASIMRMVSNSLGGEQYMNAALKQFIHKHAFGSATSDDLYACLAEQLQRASAANARCAVLLAKPGRLERMLTQWVTTSGPVYLMVKTSTAADDLNVPTISGRITISVRMFECPDLVSGLVDHLGTQRQALSPRDLLGIQHNGSDDSAPDLLSKKDRTNRSTRPSSVVLQASDHFRPAEITMPIVASVTIGKVALRNDHAGVAHGPEDQLDVTFVPPSDVSSSGQDGAAEPAVASGPLSILVNPLMHVPCRVDYDSTLWWRIVETSMSRPVKERLGIAIALFEQRTMLVGVLSIDEPFDRCNLLLRFLYELGAHRETHAVVWGYVTDALSTFINMVQDQPCWQEVRLLVIFSLKHLLGTKGISFPVAPPPRDPALDYNASQNLSGKHRCAILQTLARCGEHEVVADAKNYAEWILCTLTNDPGSISGAPAAPQVVGGGASFGGSLHDDADRPGSLLGGGAASGPTPMLFTAPMELANVHCDTERLPMEYVAIAFETAIANSDSARLWWAAVQLLSYSMFDDAQQLAQQHMSEAARATLPLQDVLPIVPDRKLKKREWVDALLPAVLACPLSEARNAQIDILGLFSNIGSPCLRVLFENSNLLTKYIETATPRAISSPLVRSIRRYAVAYAANPLVASELVGKGIVTDTAALARNSTWADYVNEHYAWYIKRQLIHHVSPADASVFSEIASKSLTAGSAGDSEPPMSARRCSI